MTDPTPLQQLAAYFADSSDHIIRRWKALVQVDASLVTFSRLTRDEFIDHIPEVLRSLANNLCLQADPGWKPERDGAEDQARKHGQHRWQQGYSLSELVREWGHLHVCLVEELEDFSRNFPHLSPEFLHVARKTMTELVNGEITSSVDQFHRLQQETASAVVSDMEATIASFANRQRHRGETLRVATHDLRGNLQLIMGTTALLERSDTSEEMRREIVSWMRGGIESLYTMLTDLLDLARLDAAHESLEAAPMDAAHVIAELCAVSRPVAARKGIDFQTAGPAQLRVMGDATKVRRVAQNLILNAIRYTPAGGVTVQWGQDDQFNWWLEVRDTGPGLQGTAAAELADELTPSPTGTSGGGAASTEPLEPVTVPAAALFGGKTDDTLLDAQLTSSGEGVGLSIVKRLCEVLDAGLTVVSSAEAGSTFRVLFPVDYPVRESPLEGARVP